MKESDTIEISKHTRAVFRFQIMAKKVGELPCRRWLAPSKADLPNLAWAVEHSHPHAAPYSTNEPIGSHCRVRQSICHYHSDF